MLRSFVTQPALSPTRPTIDPTTNFVLALCSPFLPSSRALSLSISFFLSPSLSLYLRLALRRALPLFSPMLPSVAFIPTPSLYFFFSFLTTSALSVSCPFSSSLFPCVTYSSPELGVIGRNSRTSNYRNKIFHPRRRCIYALDVLYVFSIILYDSSSRLDIFLFDFYFYFFLSEIRK